MKVSGKVAIGPLGAQIVQSHIPQSSTCFNASLSIYAMSGLSVC